jgi:hypothetical protein
VTSLFADIAIGKALGGYFRRHTAAEFRKFLDQIEANVPNDLDAHLVVDNCATQSTADPHLLGPAPPMARPPNANQGPPDSNQSSGSSPP